MPCDSFDVGAIGSERCEALLRLGDAGGGGGEEWRRGFGHRIYMCAAGGVEVETLGPWAPPRAGNGPIFEAR
jgi:hypothetical protein